jgi:L-aspartate oxidase
MADLVPRFLAAFHPKQTPHYFADVLILGGGLAGLRAAIEIDSSLSVLVITKDALDESSSSWAQGGIAGVMDPEDCFEDHIADTLKAGGSLCDRQVVEMVVREAPNRIQELIEWGTRFDELAGELVLGREGGHSHNRIVHALGDATGKEVMRAVTHWARQLPNLQFWRNAFTIDLLTDDQGCCGALVWNAYRGKTIVWAKQVILCTGGIGQLYRESTNPPVATGDGYAMAYRAGVELRDMEFVQFHPTVLYIAGSSRSLITEAVRGEGAHLVDAHGYRFMTDYDPRGELAPRDVVAHAIVTQMQKTQHPNVYLDLSHLGADFIRGRFPGMVRSCAEFGIDITCERIPVRPGAHYMIGGLTVDLSGGTKMSGLWACGEVASSGLHGANRLASNSLLEGLVYGAHAGRQASRLAQQTPDRFEVLPLAQRPTLDGSPLALDLQDVRNALKSLMWHAAGVRRHAAGLEQAARQVDTWCRYVLPRQFTTPDGWELQNMLTVARVIIRAALERKESRGVHLRTDFPELDQERWNRHLSWTRGDLPLS